MARFAVRCSRRHVAGCTGPYCVQTDFVVGEEARIRVVLPGVLEADMGLGTVEYAGGGSVVTAKTGTAGSIIKYRCPGAAATAMTYHAGRGFAGAGYDDGLIVKSEAKRS